MNDLLKREITLDRNHLVINQFNRIIPFRKRESSIERKTAKITSREDSSKVCNSNIYIIGDNFNKTTNNPLISIIPETNNNSIKLNNDNNNKDEYKQKEKINKITNIKEKNNFNKGINMIFQNKDKAKTFNKQSSLKKIKIGTIINKNNFNLISNNSKNQIERNKDKESFVKKKIINLENSNKTIDDKKNLQNLIEEIRLKNNRRNTDGFIHLGNNKIIYNEEFKKKMFDVEKANKVKVKISKDNIKNNFNHTINLKSNELSKNNSNNNNENTILQSNSLNNDNNINNYESLLKKRKNIDINTEYQTNPVSDIFSNGNNIAKNLNNTTCKVKIKTNNFVTNIEMDKDKNFFNLTENSIKKTKSKAKVKVEKKQEPEIEIRIIETTKKDNIIFNNKRAQIPSKNTKNKNNDLTKNINEENKIINNMKEKSKTKNNCAKSKITQNQNEQINRNNTYNNNESSFFTTNINCSNIDENNNENMPMHNLDNYNFINNAHNNENINDYNINNEINNKINKDNNNITNKINNVKVFKSNSNTNKNNIFQNFHFFNENKNYNILTSNNYSSCNTGNTTNNILNLNNNSTNTNNLNNNINIKNKIEYSNIEITNRKIETQNTKELENKEELILIELDDEKNPMDTDEKLKNEDKKNEVIKGEYLNEKNIEEMKENDEEKEKEISLDKSTSLKALPIQPEDFIEKDDEFIKLLEQQSSRDNKKNKDNNNFHQSNEEDESDVIIQNSEFSINNDYSKYNYNINNKNIYQNVNIYKNYNNSNKNNINHVNSQNINLDNITMKDTSIMSNIGIKGCKSITQAGKERTGHRKKNQDNYIIEKNLNNILGFNLFAILDGHGENGHIISQLSSKYLIKKFTNISNKYNDNESLYNFLKNSYFQKIIDIFLETDKEIINQKNIDSSLSGSTCVLVIQLGEHLICSNIGDSRAILVYEENDKNKIFELSHDLKPDLPEERKRINKMGGRVDKVTDENGEKNGPYRVYMKDEDQPGLAMSRSFGDKKAKSCGVIPYPEIIEYNLNYYDSKYMVICSDGVWEFLTNEEVMFIGNKYYIQNNMNDFCNELLKKSTELWENEESNYMDDITIVTVFF